MTATVVGVVNDYVYGNMYTKSDPVMFVCTSPQNTTVMYVRVKPSIKSDLALTKIEGVMKKDNAAYPFEYRFVDDQFNAMFQDEALISKLSRVFATLAIIISCLGLFGLAAYTAERRTKEIGIRKVLGASVSGITALLSIDFLKLIAVSAFVSFPIAWWIMNKWLMNYEYRVTISAWVFVIAGLLAVIIALVTISFQSVKAALMNPVKSLRSE
jgi:ABC-type antimicrobial peptide transport system permease subunit